MVRVSSVGGVGVKLVMACVLAGMASVAHADLRRHQGSTDPVASAMAPPRAHFEVGVTADRASEPFLDQAPLDDQLFGVSVAYWRGNLGGVFRLYWAPTRRTMRSRGGVGFGVRTRATLLGVDWFLGAGTHAEIRLYDHVWLLYAVPAEVGVNLYAKKSSRVQLFVGSRYILGGDLIKSFIIDPNGFPHAELERRIAAEIDSPWEAYVSLVFARRID